MKTKLNFIMPKRDDRVAIDFLQQDLELKYNLKDIALNIIPILGCLAATADRISYDCDKCRLFNECTAIISSMAITPILLAYMEKIEAEDGVLQ
jgi:hypothetical protein